MLSRARLGLDPSELSAACRDALRRLLEDVGPFNVYHMDGPCGPAEQGNWGSGDAFACGASGALAAYLATREAQVALHAIAPGAEPLRWRAWDGDGPYYNITAPDVLPEYQRLLSAGARVLIYNGLRDTALPFNGAQRAAGGATRVEERAALVLRDASLRRLRARSLSLSVLPRAATACARGHRCARAPLRQPSLRAHVEVDASASSLVSQASGRGRDKRFFYRRTSYPLHFANFVSMLIIYFVAALL